MSEPHEMSTARPSGAGASAPLVTRFTRLVGIRHPIVLGGMALSTSPELVAAVSNAGGLGIIGASRSSPQEIGALAERIRQLTDRPFGMNLLLHLRSEERLDAVLAARPHILSTAWRWPDQDLRVVAERAHEKGSIFMHMVDTLEEAQLAADAGADVIVAQGTEAGGHVGLMATLPLARMVVRALPSVPVLAAGGIADGAGLAAVLVLGADGALLGTRFLATPESPLPDGYKHAILDSDGHDTVVSELLELARGEVWPGAYSRMRRNAFVREWLGREGALRRRRREVQARLQAARAAGDSEHGVVLIGQDAGLIDTIEPAGPLVEHLANEAAGVLRARSEALL